MVNNLQAFLAGWDKGHIDADELLRSAAAAFPSASREDLSAAVEAVAHGPFSPASSCAAAALCRLHGLGDPLETAFELHNRSADLLTEPKWFLAIVGYGYNWICNAGLVCCYLDFGDRQFADRIRLHEAIRADTAAQVLREADLLYGPVGPPAAQSERQARTSDAVWAGMKQLSPRFWACGDEIFTRAYLYALEHPGDFAGPGIGRG